MKTYLCNIIGKANVDLEKVKREKKKILLIPEPLISFSFIIL